MISTASPAAYLRRSYVDPDSPGDISLEAQRTAVARLATADGHVGTLTEYNDWGVSADIAKANRRTEFSRLLSDMEAGHIAAVYAFDVDRLYRDPEDFMRLRKAARLHSVKVVTTAGPLATTDEVDPFTEATAWFGAVFARMELMKIKKRNKAAQEARRERGDEFGHPPHGYKHERDDQGRIVRVRDESVDLQPILDTYREAGSIAKAARMLNERGVPSAKGKRWYTSALTRVIARNWPDELPRIGASGKRVPANRSAIFSQLVHCRCGHVMTPNTVRKQLYCSHGYLDPSHGKPYNVSEAILLPWAKLEAAKLHLPDEITFDTRSESRRAELEAKRQRIIDNYEDGLIDRAERDRKIEALAGELDKIEAAVAVRSLPTLAWDFPEAHINSVLRAMWEYIELGSDMRPIKAVWRVPQEWTAETRRGRDADRGATQN